MHKTKQKEYCILVVEDEVPILNVIEKKLKGKNFKVLTVRTVKEAMDYVEQGQEINVVWLDHYLFGKENGLDFIVKFKKDYSKLKKVPVFVVSNTATDETVKDYMEYGAEKYYVKADCRLEQIVEDIENCLENRNLKK